MAPLVPQALNIFILNFISLPCKVSRYHLHLWYQIICFLLKQTLLKW